MDNRYCIGLIMFRGHVTCDVRIDLIIFRWNMVGFLMKLIF